jgi:hypothetical protein
MNAPANSAAEKKLRLQIQIAEAELDVATKTAAAKAAPEPEPEPQPQETSALGYGIQLLGAGAAGVNEQALALANLPSQAVNTVTGNVNNWFDTEIPAIAPWEDTVFNTALTRGAASPPIPRGQDKISDAINTATSWANPNPFSKFSKVEALIPALATAGDYVGGEGGELAGGVTGIGLALSRNQLGKAGEGLESLYKSGVDSIRNVLPEQFLKNATKQAQPDILSTDKAQDVLRFVKDNAHDYTAAMDNLKLAIKNDEIGDLGDLTRDQGLQNLTTGIEKGTPEAAKLNELTDLRDEQTIKGIREVFEGGGVNAVEDAKRIAQERVTNTTGLVQSRTKNQATTIREADAQAAQVEMAQQQEQIGGFQQARQAQLEKELDLSTSIEQQAGVNEATEAMNLAQAEIPLQSLGSKADTSTGLAQATKAAIKEEKKTKVTPKWEAFKGGKKLKQTDFNLAYNDFAKTEPPQAAEKLHKHPLIEQMLDMQDDAGKVDQRDVANLISEMKAFTRHPDNKGKHIATQMGEVHKRIEHTLKAKGRGQAYEKAKVATRTMKEKFGGNELMKAAEYGDPRVYARSLFKGDEAGAVSADTILNSGDEKIIKSAEEYILSRGKTEGIDEKFVAKYEDFLDVWGEKRPDFNAKIDNLIDAQARSSSATARGIATEKKETALRASMQKQADIDMETGKANIEKDAGLKRSQAASKAERAAVASEAAGEKRVSGLEKTITKQFADKPERVIGNLITERGGHRELKRLSRRFKTDTERAAFKTAVGEEAIQKITNNRGQVTVSTLNKIVEMRKNLQTLLSPDEIIALEKNAERVLTKKLKERAKGMTIESADDELVNLTASLASFVTMKVAPVKSSLIMANATRRFFKKTFSKALDAEKVAVLNRILLEPSEFIKLAEKSKGADNKLIDKLVKDAVAKYRNPKHGLPSTHLGTLPAQKAAEDEDE